MSRPAGVCEPCKRASPNFRQFDLCDSFYGLRISIKLGTPETFYHLRDDPKMTQPGGFMNHRCNKGLELEFAVDFLRSEHCWEKPNFPFV